MGLTLIDYFLKTQTLLLGLSAFFFRWLKHQFKYDSKVLKTIYNIYYFICIAKRSGETFLFVEPFISQYAVFNCSFQLIH